MFPRQDADRRTPTKGSPLSSTDFQIDIDRSDAAVRLVLAGEFDLAGVDRYKECFQQVEQTQPKEIVIDLRELTFIDSSGLRMLLEADRASRTDGFQLLILGPPEPIKRVFETTGLDKHLPFSDGTAAQPSVDGAG